MAHPYEEVEATVQRMRDAFAEAEQRGKWSWIADELYHDDAVYVCPYGGTMFIKANGKDEISRTHYGRDMDAGSGWKGWTFPILDWAINGDQVITHWVNRGPGARADGSYYEQHGVSFITYGGGGKFSSQYDLFDIAHMIRLCDELEAAGLLEPALKVEWVEPMRERIQKMMEGVILPAPTH